MLHSMQRGFAHALCAAACLSMAACSTAPKKDGVSASLALQEKVDGKLSEADTAFKAGNAEQALSTLDDAIKLDPAAKQPWLKKSQYHFEKRQYGLAITEAQEVLQRDVNDNTARSILAVSGLRVSADALEQLRKANEVTGSARTEAESVAKIIREALGEPLLVPAPVAPQQVAKPVARSVPRVASAAPAAASAAVATGSAGTPVVRPVSTTSNTTAAVQPAAVKPRPTPAPAAAGNGRSNPFGALQ